MTLTIYPTATADGYLKGSLNQNLMLTCVAKDLDGTSNPALYWVSEDGKTISSTTLDAYKSVS